MLTKLLTTGCPVEVKQVVNRTLCSPRGLRVSTDGVYLFACCKSEHGTGFVARLEIANLSGDATVMCSGLQDPRDVVEYSIDGKASLLICDFGLRKLYRCEAAADSKLCELAGTGERASQGGPLSVCAFNGPVALVTELMSVFVACFNGQQHGAIFHVGPCDLSSVLWRLAMLIATRMESRIASFAKTKRTTPTWKLERCKKESMELERLST